LPGEWLLVLMLALPFAASCVPVLVSKSRLACWLASLCAVLACLALYATTVLAGVRGSLVLLGSESSPIVGFFVDDMALVLAGVVLIVGLAVILFSYDYMSPSNTGHPCTGGWGRYYSLLLLFMASMIGVAFSQTFLTLLVFYELTGICSCLLIAFYGGKEDVIGGMKAFILTSIGGLLFLAAIVFLYLTTGSVDFKAVQTLDPRSLSMLGLLLLVAAWAKSAQIPFQLWLPAAMVAPTPVSAYLHAAAMVKVGVFMFARFLQYAAPVISVGAGGMRWLAWVALAVSLFTVYYAALAYYRQHDLKRLLAFSTISQLAVMFCAESFVLFQGTTLGVYAAMYYLWNHAFAKALLFLSVGALAYSVGSREVSALKGVMYKKGLSIVGASWILGALAISTIPPLNLFLGKLAILFTGFKGPVQVLVAAVLLMAEGYLLALPIFMKLAFSTVSRENMGETMEPKTTPTVTMRIALVILMILCLVSPLLFPASMPFWWSGS